MGFILNPYRYASGVAAWSPASLGSTLKGWYDADQQTEGDGNPITTLVDRSGNGFDFTKLSTNGPVLRHNYVNSKKAMDIDAGRGMSGSSSLLNGASAATMMIVVKGFADPTTSPDDEGPIQAFTTAASNKCHFFTDGNIYENFGSTTRRNVNPSTSWAAWRIYGVTSATNDWNMWYDGTAIITSGTNTVNTGSTTRRLFDADAAAGNFKGQCAEIVFCDTALSTLNRQKLEGYYAHKYGLTANLPVGHPYISSPP